MKVIYSIILLLLSKTMFGQSVNDPRSTVTMKEYVDMITELNRQLAQCRSDANRNISDVQFQNISDNVTKANAANEKRLDGMNEFRKTLEDSNSTYVTWPALLGLMVGVSGFIFGYANYMNRKREREEKEKDRDTAAGKAIISGDKVEVKK